VGRRNRHSVRSGCKLGGYQGRTKYKTSTAQIALFKALLAHTGSAVKRIHYGGNNVIDGKVVAADHSRRYLCQEN